MTCKEYGNIRLWHGDCMDLMRDKPEDHWDLAIVDPPYGIGDTFISHSTGEAPGKLERKHKEMDWDDDIPHEKYFNSLKSISSKRIIWGANYFNCFEEGGALIWYKNKGAPSLSQCEIASVSGQQKVDYYYLQSLGGFIKTNECNIHPTQKPVKLYRWILQNYAEQGDTILDTHGGSMSLAIACYIEGFQLDIIELDEDYYNDAVNRFEEHISQKVLFQA